MDRIKITIPDGFLFSTSIEIRITDINYGNHVGNDNFLTLMHEARVRYLASFGFTEMDCGGVGLIMSDAAIEFKKELFYGHTAIVSVKAGNINRVGFDLFYQIEFTGNNGEKTIAAKAKTGMLCYDYNKKKVVAVPQMLSETLN